MCGIAGILHFDKSPIRYSDLSKMASTLAKRGPDGEGFSLLAENSKKNSFYNAEALSIAPQGHSYAFAHRRLAIIDLTTAGLQPMANEDKSLWITYNGEIYNYLEIREELKNLGRIFKTSTDTEVLLQAYDEWGIDCQQKLNGMWAFAIWDNRLKRIFISRDRFGIKPLYYSFKSKKFAFASEPKALLQLDWITKEPDQKAIADYLVHSREDCFSWTFFKNISRLNPGCFIEIPFASNGLPEPKTWWNIYDSISQSSLTDDEAQEKFIFLFKSSIKLRLRSDVPIGTCLSGGLDSSAVVCVARPWLKNGSQKSYSAVYNSSFDEDESHFIDKIVEFTKIENYRCQPSIESLMEEIPKLIYQQDEPFGSTSQYAQYKVFELVKKYGTTVTLDGQGADEELAGYHYFFPVHFAGILKKFNFLKAYREFLAYTSLTGAPIFTNLFSMGAGFFSHRSMIRLANLYDKGRTVNWVKPHIKEIAKKIYEPAAPNFDDFLNQRLYQIFSVSGLPALLRYEDRNSMAFGVEARLPFMDHRLVSFLFSLPPNQKIRNGYTKYVMRSSLKGIIPEYIRNRSDKIGFATPEASWYSSGPMYKFMKEIFESDKTKKRDLYNTNNLLTLLNNNASGKINGGRTLWRALNLEYWFRVFID